MSSSGPALLQHAHRELYQPRILAAISAGVLKETSLEGAELLNKGKVRDVYKCPSGNLALVTTDRQSAFDRVLAAIPFKGMVLNRLAAWWFSKTADIVTNGALSFPHPNVTMALPIEGPS